MATINGTAGNDSLVGTTGNDTLNGLGGNDTLNGNGGVDFYDGGTGFDSIDLRTRTSSNLVVDFESGQIIAGAVLIGTFTGVERVQAGIGNDSLFGTTGGQNLAGQGGQDTLHGASGIDTLWGGSGNDHFLFREAGSVNADILGDFASGADKISLDRDVLAGLGAAGNFTAGDARFAANASGTAQDASDRVIFETDTRQIWYDADGNGAGARQLVATLQSGATLVATDVVVSGNPTDGETITGTEGDDTLIGGLGNDTINGLGGDDYIDGSEGDDLLDGGAGNDWIESSGGDDTVLGGSGNDTLTGTHVSGGDGNDVLNLESIHGPDTLDGGAGDDIFYANAGDVLIDSGGIDTIVTNESWTLAAGFENLDFENFTLRDDGMPGLEGYGNELDNVMETYGGNGGLLDGRAGNDTLIGGSRDGDTLFGGTGNDVLEGVGMFDRFMFTVAPGAANADQITDFTPDSDKVVLDGAVHANLGPSGNFAEVDARFWASGTGTAHDADDRVLYNTATGQLWYDADGTGAAARQLVATLQGAPAITAADFEAINGSAPGSVINGTSGNDTLSGTSGDDTINGLGGNDLILAGSTGGADVIDGGAGNDSIEFKAAATSAVIVNFNAGTITGGSAGGTISFTGIERVVAGNFNDSMSGTVGSQNLAGQAGADTLTGGAGNDTLWGGTGNDAFLFNGMGSVNADRISDFTSGQDKVQLEDTAFTAIGATGNFAAGDARFWAAAGASSGHDVNDRVIYNTSSGALYYDADGSGSGAAQLVATLTTIPIISASDIAVI